MEKVLFEARGQVAYVTYNRPERLNACDAETYALLAQLWRRFDADPTLRVAILSGSGERAFCAGSDIKGEGFGNRAVPAGNGLFDVLGFQRKPIIAAIHGHCNGGGLEQAMACDIRVASPQAIFGLGEVRLGVLPGGGGTQRLPRLIPRGRALEMLYTGNRIGAEEALRLGLVDHVVPHAQLMEKCAAIAAEICLSPPLAVEHIRAAVMRGMELPLVDGLQMEREHFDFLRGTADAAEGASAFAQKRVPQWQGR
jgi:enoyl-CoA hydratase/E-phenylitaconyl-CoA hydratase